MYVREILLKEEEKHRLIYIGIINNWAEVVRLTEKTFEDKDKSLPFSEVKRQLLAFFYNSILSYKKFIQEEKTSNQYLKRHHLKKTEAYVLSLRDETNNKLDMELKTPSGITFAWYFSNRIQEEMYDYFCRKDQIFAMPQEIDNFFFEKSRAMYPLDIKKVIEQLEADDSSFWSVCAQYMQYISRTTVNYLLRRSDNSGFSDLIRDQTWTDAYHVMRSRLVEKQGKIPNFENGRDFRNYMIKVCKYLAGNIHHQYMQKPDYIEDLPIMNQNFDNKEEKEDEVDATFFEEEENPHTEMDRATYRLDINADNPYEVAYTVSIILLNSSHPFYSALVDGIEDKVRILIDKATNGMSYNDIVAERYDEQNIRKDEFQRAVVKARKDYERVRKLLCDRLRDLVKKKKI